MPCHLNLHSSFHNIDAAAVCAFILNCLRTNEAEGLGVNAGAFRACHAGASMNSFCNSLCSDTSISQWVIMISRNSHPHFLHLCRVIRTTQFSPRLWPRSIPRVLRHAKPQSGQLVTFCSNLFASSFFLKIHFIKKRGFCEWHLHGLDGSKQPRSVDCRGCCFYLLKNRAKPS